MAQDSTRIENLRNIGIIAHIDAGKTTLTERVLYYTGRTHKIGEVHDGEAVMDFLPEEQDRGITIMSAVTSCLWKGAEINIIDTPGHVDFTIEVERSLRVLDGAVGVFCAVGGVQPQSETVWRQADRFGVPKLAFVNKIDRVGADFERVLEQLRTKLSANPLVITRPVMDGDEFLGVVNLLTQKFCSFDDRSLGAEITETEIPGELRAEMAAERKKTVETVALTSDDIMESYLADEEIDPERLKKAIRAATISLDLVPVFAGAALRNKGVQPLLDGIVDFLPSPADLPPVAALDPDGERVIVRPGDNAPLVALVFKIQMMEQGRKLSFARIYAGTLKEGGEVTNTRTGQKDKIGRIFRINAGKRDRIPEAKSGDLIGVVGLRSAATGDTFCSDEKRPVLLETIRAADPVISVAVEPLNAQDGPKLLETLGKLAEEDPTFKLKVDKDTGQTVISGMGELHLDVLIHRLAREHGVTTRVGKPQVVHRETVTGTAEGEGSFSKPGTGGSSRTAKARVRIRPLARGTGSIAKSLLPAELPYPASLAEAAVDTLRDGLATGSLMGYPVLDMETDLVSLDLGEAGADEPTVRIAVSQAFRQAMMAASPVLMEPVMKLEVTSPEEFVGEIVGDINSRQGRVEDLTSLPGGFKVILASAPLSRVLDYSTAVRSQTQGRGSFLMRFDHFDIVEKKPGK
ncbi:MAG: elongation factor G [Deltaproteobacteria bacterium]|jgi:elongation factor G|nr:elongation factor G [Deltaproteobacteria bacterium]